MIMTKPNGRNLNSAQSNQSYLWAKPNIRTLFLIFNGNFDLQDGPSPTVQPFYFYFLSILISNTGQAQYFRIFTIGPWPFCCPYRAVRFSGFSKMVLFSGFLEMQNVPLATVWAKAFLEIRYF
jgi:hypothetical protein